MVIPRLTLQITALGRELSDIRSIPTSSVHRRPAWTHLSILQIVSFSRTVYSTTIEGIGAHCTIEKGQFLLALLPLLVLRSACHWDSPVHVFKGKTISVHKKSALIRVDVLSRQSQIVLSTICDVIMLNDGSVCRYQLWKIKFR